MDINLLAALVGAGGAALVGATGFFVKWGVSAIGRLRLSVQTLRDALEAEKELNQELRMAAELQKQVADAVKRAIGGPGV